MSEKPGSSLQNQQSGNSVAGIPIKKRLLAWTKAVSTPLGVVSCKIEGLEASAQKSLLSESDPTKTETDPTQTKKARKHSSEIAIDMRTVPSGSQRESFGKGGLHLVLGHHKGAGKTEEPTIDNRSMFPREFLAGFRVPPLLSAREGNAEGKAIPNSKPVLQTACKIEEPAVDNRSMFPQESPSEVRAPPHLSAVKENAEGKIIPNSDPTWQGVLTFTGSTGTLVSFGHPLMEYGVTPTSTVLSGQPSNQVYVKLEKMDSCSHSMASVGHSQLKKQTDSETKAESCHKSRLNWDLNTNMEAWEGFSSESTMNHEGTKDLGLVDKCSLARVQMEANGSDLIVGQSSSLDTDQNPNLSTLSLSTSEHFSSQASLDLQLRPPCKSNLGLNLGVSSHLSELNSSAGMSELSLSLPGNVNSEPSVSGKPTSKEVSLSSKKIIVHGQVKLEQCDRKVNEEAPNSACSSNMKSATSSNTQISSISIVKPEPCEGPSQQCLKEPGQLLYGEFDRNNFISSGTYVAQNARAMDLFSDHGKFGLVSGIATSADNTATVTTGVVGMDMNLPSQSLAPDCGKELQNDANESCSKNGVFGEVAHSLSESAVTQGQDVNAVCETFGLAAVTSGLAQEPVGSDDKRSIATNDLSSVIGTISCNDEKLFTHKTSVADNDEQKISLLQLDKLKSSSHHGVTGTEEQKSVSGKILDAVLDDDEQKTQNYGDGDGDGDGIKEPVPKEGGRDEFEDGELRDLTLHDKGEDRISHGEDSSEKKAVDQVGSSAAVVDVPLKMPLDEGVSQIKVENLEESKDVDDSLCTDERDSCISTADNQQEVLAVGQVSVSAGEKQVTKTTQKHTVDNVVDEKGRETKSNPKKDGPARVDKDNNDKTSGTPENSKGLDMTSEKHLPKKDAPLKVNLGKLESGKDKQSRIIKLSSATDKSSHVKVKSNDNKSPLVQPEEVKMTDRPVMRSKPYSRENRDVFCKDKFQKFNSDRNQDQYSGKRGSDMIRMKTRGHTHPDASHYMKNVESEHLFGRFKKSTSVRYPRHNNSSDIAYVAPDCSIPSGGRVVRKHGEGESPNLSRLPSRRRSPGPVDREGHPVMGVQVAGRSFVSPGRCIGRDIPDSLPLNRLQFEREENAYIRRERRSLSPVSRRGIPLRFRNECLKSSPRGAQICSPHQWSPPRRSPNLFDGHPELGHIRSPPILTHDRMRSPRQRPCFPEDVMVRRAGSPQLFMPRMPDDAARELHLRRNDFMRPDRVLERNIQRFDMIDPRETSEEEYLEHLRYNEFCELAGGDERVDVRRICEERRGFVRPIRQRFNGGDDEEGLHNHVGDGPPRSFRFRHEAMEGFPDRGGSRDFNGHIRNRLGNVHDRLVDEREQYHGRQGWPESDFADVRPKRRRV